jgi:hypothetical protein
LARCYILSAAIVKSHSLALFGGNPAVTHTPQTSMTTSTTTATPNEAPSRAEALAHLYGRHSVNHRHPIEGKRLSVGAVSTTGERATKGAQQQTKRVATEPLTLPLQAVTGGNYGNDLLYKLLQRTRTI